MLFDNDRSVLFKKKICFYISYLLHYRLAERFYQMTVCYFEAEDMHLKYSDSDHLYFVTYIRDYGYSNDQKIILVCNVEALPRQSTLAAEVHPFPNISLAIVCPYRFQQHSAILS